MTSFSFAGSGSDLLDEDGGWMDSCNLPCVYLPVCAPAVISLMIRLVVHMICPVE